MRSAPAFGLYVEVHAATGARSGQIALLDVGDLQTGAKPLLIVPSSLKGKNRRTRTRKPMPISHRSGDAPEGRSQPGAPQTSRCC